MTRPQEIVSKLWHLCNILRESGITYPEYVTELTYLLFLKMAQETGSEKSLPSDCRWQDLVAQSPQQRFSFYKALLKRLGSIQPGRVAEIFRDSETCLNHSQHLNLLVAELDAINWYAAHEEGALGDLYEGLLEKNSSESKSGAGQYFTPRPLIECIVRVVQPREGELVQDPACGTGGFLVAADRYMKETRSRARKRPFSTTRKRNRQDFVGIELVRDTHRLALMNAMLHGIEGQIICGDALGDAGETLRLADVILTNPPFGTKKGGGLPSRQFPISTSNKQLAFLQHIYLGLRPGGRAAVVLPDLQGSIAPIVCADLMEKCRLHTVLRLPTGIFYAPGVKTNVYFFTKGKKDHGNTDRVWFFDLRSEMPNFGKRTPLTLEHFEEFEKAYGPAPDGSSDRHEGDIGARFRSFSRTELEKRGNNLNVTWPLAGARRRMATSPDALAKRIESRLRLALFELLSLKDA